MGISCPKCSKEFVKRVRPVGIIARLLSLVSIFPFRCQVCGHRFSTSQPGITPSDLEVDRRQYVRLATRFPATFSGERVRGEGVVTEISIGGCTLGTDASLSAGAILQLKLKPLASELPITVEAAIIRTVRTKSVGLEFLRFQPEEKNRLSRFVVQLLVPRQS